MNLRIESADMVDRQKVETVLRLRLPGADWAQIATAANAIVGLGDEWEEVLPAECRFFRRSLPDGERHASGDDDMSWTRPQP